MKIKSINKTKVNFGYKKIKPIQKLYNINQSKFDYKKN